MREAVARSFVVERPARMSNRGECLAISWTKVAPRPPGDTPVVRMILLDMAEAWWEARVEASSCSEDVEDMVAVVYVQGDSG